MGQAKLRGNKAERIEQSKLTGLPPKPGLYITTKENPGIRLVVDEVSEADEDGFFLLTLLSEANAKNMSGMGQEMTSEDWFSFSDQFGLIYSPS